MKGGLSLRYNAENMKQHLTAVVGEILGTAMFLFIVSTLLNSDIEQKTDVVHPVG